MGVSRSTSAIQEGGIEWRPCDASDPDQVATVFRDVRPNIVYNLTSDSQGGRDVSLVQASVRNDVVATTNVLVEAVRHKVNRVVIPGSLEEPKGNADDAIPASPYAAAKWASSSYSRMFSALYDMVQVKRNTRSYPTRSVHY